jgi:hypothetical protein
MIHIKEVLRKLLKDIEKKRKVKALLPNIKINK